MNKLIIITSGDFNLVIKVGLSRNESADKEFCGYCDYSHQGYQIQPMGRILYNTSGIQFACIWSGIKNLLNPRTQVDIRSAPRSNTIKFTRLDNGKTMIVRKGTTGTTPGLQGTYSYQAADFITREDIGKTIAINVRWG